MGCPQSKEPELSSTFTDLSEAPAKTVDPRLPFATYRQLFNMKNSWKAVARTMEATAKSNLLNFLKKHPEYWECHKDLLKYKEDEEKMQESTAFENDATVLFNTIDYVMEKAETDVDGAIKNLKLTGRTYSKMPKFTTAYFKDMEDVFLDTVKDVLGDRFTEPTEQNFRSLWEFCTQQMTSVIEAA